MIDSASSNSGRDMSSVWVVKGRACQAMIPLSIPRSSRFTLSAGWVVRCCQISQLPVVQTKSGSSGFSDPDGVSAGFGRAFATP